MIKFFRRIRQRLISENKFKNYLFYAFGEIFLVVIGILIAIQLNELNQNRNEEKQYNLMLENLDLEFSRTQELLTRITSSYASTINTNVSLMGLFSGNQDTISAQKIDTLLGLAMNQTPFYPPQPVLDELLNSGKIKAMPNEKLKQYLFDWESTLKWFHFDYDLLINFSNNQLNSYLNKNWSWKNIDIASGTEFYNERSKLSPQQNELFSDLEFENLVDTNLFHTNRLYSRLKEILSLIDKIRSEIEVSLHR